MNFRWLSLTRLLKDVILEISSKRLGCTAVVDDKKNLLGIITDGDFGECFKKISTLMKLQLRIS